jgi:hypothetical protein
LYPGQQGPLDEDIIAVMMRRRSGLGASAADADFLRAALLGYQQQRAEIESRMAELRRQLGQPSAAVDSTNMSDNGTGQMEKRRALSAAARKRIGDAQRMRWAALRKESVPAQAEPAAPVAKRKMSAAAKRRIADAQRKRWAAFRAKKAQPAASPKVKAAGA